MKPVDITLTDAAAARLQELSTAESRRLMLRVAVEGGGCSGFQYKFDLVETTDDDDAVITNGEAAAVVDVISQAFLKGAQIDFAEDLAAAEFRIRNPNAKSSCGCGVSFSI